MTYLYGEDANNTMEVRLGCKTVLFFCKRERRGLYSKERSGVSVETARERVRLARFTREDHTRLPNREEKTNVLQCKKKSKMAFW